jgi:hypothetical protein
MDTSFGAQYEYGKCCCFPTWISKVGSDSFALLLCDHYS